MSSCVCLFVLQEEGPAASSRWFVVFLLFDIFLTNNFLVILLFVNLPSRPAARQQDDASIFLLFPLSSCSLAHSQENFPSTPANSGRRLQRDSSALLQNDSWLSALSSSSSSLGVLLRARLLLLSNLLLILLLLVVLAFFCLFCSSSALSSPPRCLFRTPFFFLLFFPCVRCQFLLVSSERRRLDVLAEERLLALWADDARGL